MVFFSLKQESRVWPALGPTHSAFCRETTFALSWKLIDYFWYLSGTSTQLLHRGHFALASPVSTLTRRIAFLTRMPSASGTTIFVRQVGHRCGSARTRRGDLSSAEVAMGRILLLSIGIIKNKDGRRDI
jgi:hypothetical protein